MREQTIEAALETLYATPELSPDFVDRLEARLLAEKRLHATAGNNSRTGILLTRVRHGKTTDKRPYPRRRLAAVGLVILLILSLSLTAFGPRRVLTALQNLLGYVPGIGFVDLESSRLLAAPVSQTRDGVTLHIEELIAHADETILVLSSEGLPPMTDSGVATDTLLPAQLRLPDGTMLQSDESSLSYGRGRYDFPPLPADVHRVTLLLPRLPLLPADAAPENWEAPLALRMADGNWTDGLYPQSYQPEGAEITRHGITLRVVEAAHTAEVTAIKTEVTWEEPAWRHFSLSGGRFLPLLRDDLGHTYGQTHENVGSVAVARIVAEADPASTPHPAHSEATTTYAPISLAARQLTLVVDALSFEVPANETFTVDLGPAPQIGDEIPLAITLDVAGFPVHLTAARLVEVEEFIGPDEIEKQIQLVFAIEPVADSETYGLRGIDFEADGFSGSSGGYTYDTNQLRAALKLAEGAPLPSGSLEIQVTGARIWVLGPWEVGWTLPDAPEIAVQPRVLRPDAALAQQGVTVGIAEMTLTDQVTAVQFRVETAGSGGEVFPYPDLKWGQEALYLEDNRGRRYDPAAWTIRWQQDDFQPEEAGDPNRVMFFPLDPLARGVTVNVPAVLVALSETAVVSVTIPENVTVQPPANPMVPPRSAAWPVNIPISMTGYDLVFTEAWLQEVNPGQVLLILETTELPQSANGPWLRELHIGQVSGPAGLLPVSEWTRGSAGLLHPPGTVQIIASDAPALDEPEPPRSYRAGLSIDLGDADPAGMYRIELTGGAVQIEGPWRIPVALP